VLTLLEQRAAQLQETVVRREAELNLHSAALPRVTLLETEYQRTIVAAELDWLTQVMDDLRTRVLTWTEELADLARSYLQA
jgi:hypothetical protein